MTRPGELAHPLVEADLWRPTQLGAQTLRRCGDVAHVAEAVLAGDDRREASGVLADRRGEVADRVYRAASDVEGAKRVGFGRRGGVDRGEVRARDIRDMDEITALTAVLEDPRRLAALDRVGVDFDDRHALISLREVKRQAAAAAVQVHAGVSRANQLHCRAVQLTGCERIDLCEARGADR